MVCAECRKFFTASWSTGRSQRYALYRCNQKQCVFANKSINRNTLHAEFEKLLTDIEPTEEAVKLTEAIVSDVWSKKKHKLQERQKESHSEIQRLDEEIENLSSLVAKTDQSSNLLNVYEEKIDKLSREREQLRVKQSKRDNEVDFETAFSVVLERVKKPLAYWKSGDLKTQKAVFNLCFVDSLAYHLETGFETANLSPIYGIFQSLSDSNSQDVEMAGLEPASDMGSRVTLQGLVRLIDFK